MQNRSVKTGTEGETLVGGTDGSGNVVPVQAARFHPMPGEGGKVALTGASVRIGPLTHGKAHHFFTDQVGWVATGDGAVNATSSDTPVQVGPVYEYTPTDASDDHLAFIRDTVDGSVWYGRAEQ